MFFYPRTTIAPNSEIQYISENYLVQVSAINQDDVTADVTMLGDKPRKRL